MEPSTVQHDYSIKMADLLQRFGLTGDYGPGTVIKVSGLGDTADDPKPGTDGTVYGSVTISIRQKAPAG